MEKEHCCSKCVYFNSFYVDNLLSPRFPISTGEKMPVCFYDRQASIFDACNWLHQRMAICRDFKEK